MSISSDITDDTIRQHLLDRVSAYQERSKLALWRISKAATGDDKFLANVQRGGNFTIKTYQRVIDWLDEQDAERAA